jgi:hypothetical protein
MKFQTQKILLTKEENKVGSTNEKGKNKDRRKQLCRFGK